LTKLSTSSIDICDVLVLLMEHHTLFIIVNVKRREVTFSGSVSFMRIRLLTRKLLGVMDTHRRI